jgi:DNA-binding GntR family transcriptional regulator
MKTFSKIKTSSDQAVILLRQAIISGDFKPGEKLREIEISEAIGISRSPIREAFRMLEAEGLVEIAPNKGATVTKLNEKDIREIYELRILIEIHGLRKAMENITQENISELHGILGLMESRIKSEDYMGYLETSHEFHEFYMKNSQNERLYNLFQVLRNNILAIQIFTHSFHKISDVSLEEHRRIFQAIKEKNFEKAKNYLKRHLEGGQKRSLRFYKKTTD